MVKRRIIMSNEKKKQEKRNYAGIYITIGCAIMVLLFIIVVLLTLLYAETKFTLHIGSLAGGIGGGVLGALGAYFAVRLTIKYFRNQDKKQEEKDRLAILPNLFCEVNPIEIIEPNFNFSKYNKYFIKLGDNVKFELINNRAEKPRGALYELVVKNNGLNSMNNIKMRVLDPKNDVISGTPDFCIARNAYEKFLFTAIVSADDINLTNEFRFSYTDVANRGYKKTGLMQIFSRNGKVTVPPALNLH